MLKAVKAVNPISFGSHSSQLSLEVGVGHQCVHFNLGGSLCLAILKDLGNYVRLCPTMEPNVPSELDVAHYNRLGGLCGEQGSELDDPLESGLDGGHSPERVAGTRILQVLAIRVVETGHLTLGVTIRLQGI